MQKGKSFENLGAKGDSEFREVVADGVVGVAEKASA